MKGTSSTSLLEADQRLSEITCREMGHKLNSNSPKKTRLQLCRQMCGRISTCVKSAYGRLCGVEVCKVVKGFVSQVWDLVFKFAKSHFLQILVKEGFYTKMYPLDHLW